MIISEKQILQLIDVAVRFTFNPVIDCDVYINIQQLLKEIKDQQSDYLKVIE